MFSLRLVFITILSFFSTVAAVADGDLTDNIRIESKALGYAVQYRVYTPDPKYQVENMPTLYVTDGQNYIGAGKLHKLLNKEIAAGNIKPLVAVFVDPRSPDNLSINRRAAQFHCNEHYTKFFTDELIPAIDQSYSVSNNRQDRVILGLSFGGLNSACFGLMIPETFAGIAMQSPASHKQLKMLAELYGQGEKLPLKMFLSFGTERDNLNHGRLFKRALDEKGYDVTYKEVVAGHDWRNWKPLLDDVLDTFFTKDKD